ncbi:hypothetical protein ES703_28197 [subsurface metagenome]
MVALASKIVVNTLSYPLTIAVRMVLPEAISSLILSKIRTFASIAAPIIRTIPARPGKVNVALRPERTANRKVKFKINANIAIIPDLR